MTVDPVDLHIGSRLRMLRMEKNLSLQAVGEGLGVTYQQIRKYESGDNRVSASALYRLAAYFGIDPSYFFHGLPGVGGSGAEAKSDPSMQAVLERIPDVGLRQHLEALLRALEHKPYLDASPTADDA